MVWRVRMVNDRRNCGFFKNLKLLALFRRRRSSHNREAGAQQFESVRTSECGKRIELNHYKNENVTESAIKKRLRFNGRIYFDDGTTKLGYGQGERRNENDWLKTHCTLADFEELASIQLAQLRSQVKAKYPFLRKESADTIEMTGDYKDCAAHSKISIFTQPNLLSSGIYVSPEDERGQNTPTAVWTEDGKNALQSSGGTGCGEPRYPDFFDCSLLSFEEKNPLKLMDSIDPAEYEKIGGKLEDILVVLLGELSENDPSEGEWSQNAPKHSDDLNGKMTNLAKPSLLELLSEYDTSNIRISADEEWSRNTPTTVWTKHRYKHLQDGRGDGHSRALHPEFFNPFSPLAKGDHPFE